MGITRTLTPDEFWSMVQDSNDRVRASFKDYPLFAPAQWSGTVMLGQWSFSGDGPRGLMHGLPAESEPFIQVMTSPADAKSSAMTLWRRHHPFPQDKAEHVRNLENFAAESPVRRSVLVGGSARDFDVWERETEWWAVAEGPECQILIEAQNIDPSELALVTVEDVEPYIAGRNEWTREQRGET